MARKHSRRHRRSIAPFMCGMFVLVVSIVMLAVNVFRSCSVPVSGEHDIVNLSPICTVCCKSSADYVNKFFTNNPTSPEIEAARLTSRLTDQQKVAQLFFVTPEDLVGSYTDAVVTACGDTTRKSLEDHPVGGIIYFQKNLESFDQTQEMLTKTKACAKEICGVPILLGVDEEGGTVSRIGGNPGFDIENAGDMREIGKTGDPTKAREVALHIGTYLNELGFTANLAPVADVADNPDSNTMVKRSFGSDASMVADMVSNQIEAYTSMGIISCAKHFPGIGAAIGDSHDNLIHTDKTLEELYADELIPFEAAIEADVPMIMVGHIACPALTGDDTPASCSRQIMSDLLRDQMGYEGVIVTDSLQMGAVPNADDGTIAVTAFQAGADVLLMPTDFEAAYAAVLEAVENGEISRERLNLSVYRIVRMKLAYERM